MEKCTIALFGEAEKGEFRKGYFCQNLPQLVDSLGNPPPESRGLFYAVQTLLYQHSLIFFRVQEEGFSLQDYLIGFRLLQHQDYIPSIAAICMPGVSNVEILKATTPLHHVYHSLIITNESDLYDYLTA